jgi:shikimate kinase
MTTHTAHIELPPNGCISLIGMAGSGKTTVGSLLAESLRFAHLDTDRYYEACYGTFLQEILDSLGLKGFRQAEEEVVASLDLASCVISTGGSVIYGARAVARLKAMGPVVFLHAPLEAVRQRVGDAQGRGLAIAPGQNIDTLYQERQPLYQAAADMTLDTEGLTPAQCADAIFAALGHPASP